MQKEFWAKLSIYDIFGYIIPGFLGLFSINLLTSSIFNSPLEFKMPNQVLLTTGYLFIALFIGVVLHEISQLIEEWLFKPLWQGFPSESFLLDTDRKYNTGIKDKLKEAAQEYFKLHISKYDKKASQQVFNLFYATLQSNGKDGNAQIFNAQYGMIRNFFAGALMVTISYFIISVTVWVNNKITAKKEMFLTILGIAIMVLLGRRLKRFGDRFSDYIIRGFYIYYIEQTKNSTANPEKTPS